MSEVKEKAEAFVKYVLSKKEDRGFLSNLRKAESSTTEHLAYPILAGWVDLENKRYRKIYGAIGASLSRSKNAYTKGKGLGHTLLITAGYDRSHPPSVGRLRRILASDSALEALPHVVHALRLSESKGIPVDYSHILADLIWFGERVKARWAQEFYGYSKED